MRPNYAARRLVATLVLALTLLGAATAANALIPPVVAAVQTWIADDANAGQPCQMQPSEIRGEKICK